MQLMQQFEMLRLNLLGLGTRRLVALGVAAATVVGLVGTIGVYASRPETEPLYVGLAQADVARIGAALHEAGIPYDVGSDGTKVFVRRAQAPNARMLLAERGLPAGATSGYELFDKLGPLGLTSFMQDVTRTRALEGELARTIQTMKGVTSARVHIVVPTNGSFRRTNDNSSASIVIRTVGPPIPSTAQIIRHLVAAAVPGLSSENVSVMSTDGTVLTTGGDPAILASAKMIELEQAIARKAQDNVRRTLAPYLGVENFEVSVTARINLDKRQMQEQTWDPDSKAERSTRVIKELGNSQNAKNNQSVTVEQNLPTEQSAGKSGDQSSKSNQRREELTNFELNSRLQSTVSEGHRIETLQVALLVNRKKMPGGPDPAVLEGKLKEIEAIASSAVGLDARRGDKISVAAVEFQDVTAEPGSRQGALERLSMHLDTIIISMTAIAALLILLWLGLLPSIRTIVTRNSDGTQPQQLSVPDAPMLTVAEDTTAAKGDVGKTPPIGISRVTEIQRRLTELVEQDEKQVAEIMKQWLVKA